jgi:hypothetical protein
MPNKLLVALLAAAASVSLAACETAPGGGRMSGPPPGLGAGVGAAAGAGAPAQDRRGAGVAGMGLSF